MNTTGVSKQNPTHQRRDLWWLRSQEAHLATCRVPGRSQHEVRSEPRTPRPEHACLQVPQPSPIWTPFDCRGGRAAVGPILWTDADTKLKRAARPQESPNPAPRVQNSRNGSQDQSGHRPDVPQCPSWS